MDEKDIVVAAASCYRSQNLVEAATFSGLRRNVGFGKWGRFCYCLLCLEVGEEKRLGKHMGKLGLFFNFVLPRDCGLFGCKHCTGLLVVLFLVYIF